MRLLKNTRTMIHFTLKSNHFFTTLVLCLFLSCASVAWADTFEASEIATSSVDGTTKSHVTCSSSETSTSSKKIKNVSGISCVAIGTNADTDPGTNYLQIQAGYGYTIDNTISITGAANGTSAGSLAVLMWRGDYNATSADTCFSVAVPANNSTTEDQIVLVFPSNRFRTIRLYRRINYKEGVIGSGATGSSYQYPKSSPVAFNISHITVTATDQRHPKMLYLKPGTNWNQKGGEVNPRFAVYCYGDGEKWYDLEAVDAGCELGMVYKAEVAPNYTNCIFCRMKGDDPENNWDNKWNKTGDLTLPTADAGVYTVANDQWDGGTDAQWSDQPLAACVSGTWLFFTGESIDLTATSTGATSYQWYKNGTAEGNKIAGATSATYHKDDCVFEDAGTYYCKTRMGEGAEKTSDPFQVKTLRMYFNVGRGGTAYGQIDLHSTDPDHHLATGMIFLGETYNYAFSVADGCGNYYGQNNDPTYGAMSFDNCTGWEMNSDKQCVMYTQNGATYTFIVDYTNITLPKVSAIYPSNHQEADKVIYFDNDVLKWANPHYRIGRSDHVQAAPLSLVNGTANLYQYTTTDYTNLKAWHIADNCGWVDNNDIYRTYTNNDTYQISNSVNFEGGATTQDVLTITPSTDHSTGSDALNNNCEFYNYTTIPRMKTQNVEIIDPEGGSITVSYTDVDGTGKSFSSGSKDLAHTCILTVTTTPDCGYKMTTIKVNGVAIAEGGTHILADKASVEATFGPQTYQITYHTNGGTINETGYATTYTFGDGVMLPMDITKDGMDFAGWYDNVGLTGDPIEVVTGTDCGNKNYYAKWVTEVPKVTYILGSCYVSGGMWTTGSDGSVKAWLFEEGATVAQNNLRQTTDISYSSSSTGGIYYKSKDLSKLDTPSQWSSSSPGDRSIKALSVSKDKTLTFDLGSMQAYQITFYVFPASNDAYSIDLKVNGNTQTKAYDHEQNQWHKYVYKGGVYSGEFSITSHDKETRVVVFVEVPKVTISFDKNATAATGTMENMTIPKGATTALDLNKYTWTGHNFLGWTEDTGGAGMLYDDGADFIADADITLYAQWEEIIHTTITLDATGAYNHYTNEVVAYYNKPMPEITTIPQRVGYVFDGYYDQPNGAGTKYYGGLGNGIRPWDKTTASETLYAKWMTPCDLTPTLMQTTPVVTIWDGQKVDMGVIRLSCDFDTTGVSYELVSAVPSEPLTGCDFEYFDELIHLIGTPSIGNTTTKEITVTFTMSNSCTPATTYNASCTIRIYPASQKPKVAFIITGTEGGGDFDAYSTSDAASCNDLVTYLGTYYDITYVNGYATKNISSIEAYYDQYDLLVVTDFLNTGKGYTNAIGTLIDKKPILSFEAYVANQSNWHIGSNPKDPKPKVQKMKILCAGHAIFGDAKYMPGDATEVKVINDADTTVQVLSSLSTAKDAKGLQGFTINEAPDFIFLATIRDENNDRDLVVCCERQVVFSARLLLYGINFYEMGNLSPAGKIVMHQMMDYLLMTDETKIADCSLVFDNHAGDHKWSNPANWAPGYNIVPTPFHPTRIIAECWVDTDDAHAGSVKVNTNRAGQPVIEGKLIVKPYGGLTIAGMVQKVHDTRYATPIMINAEDLLIEADATHNGAFVYGNKESDVRATVQYYSRGADATTDSPIWQYIGIPFRAGKTAINMYRAAWMCRWSSSTSDDLGGLWQWVDNEDVLYPFEGYCISQAAAKTYTFDGRLNEPLTKTLVLDNCDGDGFAFAANSWTAPIKIKEMQDADFTNAEKSIYIYHSGSYASWNTNKENVINTAASSAVPAPGQYVTIPIHASPYIGVDSVIPAMQGFFVKTTGADAKLRLVYNRVVYDATYFKTSTQPMRAPRRGGEPEVMVMNVAGDTYGDRVHMLIRGDFSEEYEDGWDGRKIEGDEHAPKLAVVKQGGDMTVAALSTAEERFLSFRAGVDSIYTFTFSYEGETIYLYDILAEQATEIRTGKTYTFEARNKTAVNRFLITKNPPKMPTDINNMEYSGGGGDKPLKFIHEGEVYVLRGGVIYDMTGRCVSPFERKEGAQ